MNILTDTPVPGIYTNVKRYLHPDDKKPQPVQIRGELREVTGLHSYVRAELPMYRWVDCHKAGLAFCHGDMQPYRDMQGRSRYTHQLALWHGTQWLVLDLDHDNITTNDGTALQLIDPVAHEMCFAVCESLSSNIDGRTARWHGFVLLEEPITTREDYEALLWGLKKRLWTMTGATRQPAQPVYGNGRSDAYAEISENTLPASLMTELIQDGMALRPQLRNRRHTRDVVTGNYIGGITRTLMEDYDTIKPKRLRQFLSDFQVPLYSGAKQCGGNTLYYLPCPFRYEHTREVAATDAYISVSDNGWAFGCFHDHCQRRLQRAKKLNQSSWKVFADAVTCPVRMGLKHIGVRPAQVRHDTAARVYDNIVCPRDNAHRGTALYRKEDGQCIFLCDEPGCEPLAWQDFLHIHKTMGVAA